MIPTITFHVSRITLHASFDHARRHSRSAVAFPSPRLADAEGLVAVGGDLSVPRLLLAYRSGIFPWTVEPITWWSPDPRAIFELDGFHVSRSLAKVIRQGVFRITMDRAFRRVMQGCAAPAPGRRSTWITPEFIAAYTQLHEQGHAHSLECWQGRRLAGGVYGVAMGGLFAGESMFHRVSNASKVALFHLIEHLRRQGFVLFDIQMLTPITAQLGGVTIPARGIPSPPGPGGRETGGILMRVSYGGIALPLDGPVFGSRPQAQGKTRESAKGTQRRGVGGANPRCKPPQSTLRIIQKIIPKPLDTRRNCALKMAPVG